MLDLKATRECRRRRPPQYRGKCKVCEKFGHEEARCEFLTMFLYCKKYTEGRSEGDIQSVFKHWLRHNEKDVPFEEVKRQVDENGLFVNRIALEKDCVYSVPLTFEETCMVADSKDLSQVGEDDDK